MTIMEANTPLAHNIEKIIKKKGIKKKYVAEKSGYTIQELSDILNGRRLIKACDIPKLAIGLGVSIEGMYDISKT